MNTAHELHGKLCTVCNRLSGWLAAFFFHPNPAKFHGIALREEDRGIGLARKD